jgi:hypothetical protein
MKWDGERRGGTELTKGEEASSLTNGEETSNLITEPNSGCNDISIL